MAEKVITFGEIMLRLAPEGYYRFIQADKYGVNYGGGEANVAVSLANYGFDTYFVSKLPDHEIGQAGVNALRRYGVDTSYITRGGDRVGIYFLEKGASQRPSKVNLRSCRNPLLQLHPERILIGKKYLKEQSGFILQESHLHSVIRWQRFVWKPVRLQKRQG